MMEFIFNIDYYLFDLINQKMSNPIFDVLLVYMRNENVWLPLYIFIIAFSIYNFKSKAYYIILTILLTIGISDTVSSRLIKNNVKRDRPCRNEHVEQITRRVKCGAAYSFTSSHATNHFALSTFLAFTFGLSMKRIKWPLYIWASLICLAQVYVGVHFPLDVFCGALLGISIGYIAAFLVMKYYYHIFVLH